MSLTHLNSDQRQYFWMSILLAGAFSYFAFKAEGLRLVYLLVVVVASGGCAVAIFRRWRHAAWLYLFVCFCLIGWPVAQFITKGSSSGTLWTFVGGLLSFTGFYWLRKAMNEPAEEAEANESSDLFTLPQEHEKHVDALVEGYTQAFGDPQWMHHIVPKCLWLHRYAEYVVTIPPTDSRPTWLYGTLLLSALSGSPVELIIERPEEDAIGAIGTLARLTDYVLEYAPLEEWNTMGTHPFFGEDSAVRGLLFCKPPDSLADMMSLASGGIALRYVAGITEDQLIAAQTADDAQGNFAGAKALHAELRIADEGISYLAN